MSSKSARDDRDLDDLKRELSRYVPDNLMRKLTQLLDAMADHGIEADDDLPRAKRPWAAQRDLGEFAGTRPDTGARFAIASDSIAFDAHPGSAQGSRAFRQALAACAPVLGESAALAYDSADAVFRAAIGALGGPNPHALHRTALAPVFTALMQQRNRQAAATGGELRRGDRGFALHAELANDDAGFARRFPSAARVKTLG